LIVVAGAAVYSNTLGAPFTYDDYPNIANNAAIRTLWPTVAMRGTSRPVASYSFALNFAIHGQRVGGYHVVNLAIHLAGGLCLYGIARRSFVRVGGRFADWSTALALAIALLWVVHPLQTQAVTYIVQRMESLMGLMYLATLYFFIRAQESKHPRGWLAASVLVCALGMGCKEAMVSAPLIVLWYDRAFVARSWPELFRSRGLYYAGLAATWAVLAGSMMQSKVDYEEAGVGRVAGLTPWTYLLSQSEVIVHYLRLCIWPRGQVFDYLWPVSHSVFEVLPSALAVVGLLAATAWCLVRHPKLSFLGGWFFFILAPTSSIVPIKHLAFEHRMYLSLAAVAVVFVLLLHYGVGWLNLPPVSSRRVFAIAIAVIVLALGVTAYARNRVYRSEIALWSDNTAKMPTSSAAWANLGTSYFRAKNYTEARRCLEKALRLDPQSATTNAGYAGVLIQIGDYKSARQYLSIALQINPNGPTALTNLGHLLLDTGHYEEAIEYYQRVLQLEPDEYRCRTSLAAALIGSGRLDEAIDQCQLVLAIQPNSAEAHVNLATALAALGNKNEALQHAQAAVRFQPDHADARATLANLLAPIDPPAAHGHMDEALRLSPRSAMINLGMGNLLAPEDPAAAIPYFQVAIEVRPDFAEAHFNLANAWVALGQPQNAIGHLKEATRIKPDWEAAQKNLQILRRSLKGQQAGADS
jgi:tetratricopeptide (TPR) repeat protein